MKRFCVQYVSDSEADSGKFPIISLASCCPTLSALMWKMMMSEEERIIQAFLSHKWAAQIRMDEVLEDYELTWEVLFQKNDAISKSRNPNKGSHVKEFQPAFLPDQKRDRYSVSLLMDGKILTDTWGPRGWPPTTRGSRWPCGWRRRSGMTRCRCSCSCQVNGVDVGPPRLAVVDDVGETATPPPP